MSKQTKPKLLTPIQSILVDKGLLKAREIVKELSVKFRFSVDKSHVNALLYQFENIYFKIDGEYSWTSIQGSNKGAASQAAQQSHAQGVLIAINDPVTGEYKGRAWKKQDLLLKSEPDKSDLHLTVWNDKFELAGLKPGCYLKVIYFEKARSKASGKSKNYLELCGLELISQNPAEDDLPF